MANNYSQLSAKFKIGTQNQEEWLKKYMPLTLGIQDDNLFTEFEEEARDLGLMPSADWDDFNESYYQEMVGPSYEFEPDGLWVFAEEGFECLDGLAFILKAFLNKFNLKGSFNITWANYCSALRLDEFGGGALVITNSSIIYFSTHNFVAENTEGDCLNI